MATQLADTPARDARRAPRHLIGAKGSARIALQIDVIDASEGGVRARLSVPLPVGALLKITLAGQSRHARIAWTDGEITGCEWLAPLERHEMRAVLAQSAG
jgi:hypothetical protein